MTRMELVLVIALISGVALLAIESPRNASATTQSSPPLQRDVFCGTKIDSSTSTELAKTDLARKQFLERAPETRPSEVVNVHFHVIQTEVEGAVDDATLATQVDVLNDSFSLRGTSFLLASIDRTLNSSWFNGCDSGPAKQMKRLLHQGSATDLNVYICKPRRVLGIASFPWLYAKSPAEDGIVLHYSVLPGGSDPSFNTGKVLAHETGHWMGLFHTFQGGCIDPGDEVDDTPAEASASFAACPLGLDTCPSPGLDPTDNYMDYSGDSCWTTFTPGQNDRMASMFAIYRLGQ